MAFSPAQTVYRPVSVGYLGGGSRLELLGQANRMRGLSRIQTQLGRESRLGKMFQTSGDDWVDRTKKEELVALFNNAFSDATLVVVTSQTGLTVAQSTELRREMRNAGASFKVTKNRLTCLALKGTKFEHLSALFKGPTAIAYSDDPVAAARVAVKFSDDNDRFEILGGALDEQALDISGVITLSKLPSLDELRAKLVGMIQTPATRIAGITRAPAGQLARVLAARAELGEAA